MDSTTQTKPINFMAELVALRAQKFANGRSTAQLRKIRWHCGSSGVTKDGFRKNIREWSRAVADATSVTKDETDAWLSQNFDNLAIGECHYQKTLSCHLTEIRIQELRERGKAVNRYTLGTDRWTNSMVQMKSPELTLLLAQLSDKQTMGAWSVADTQRTFQRRGKESWPEKDELSEPPSPEDYDADAENEKQKPWHVRLNNRMYDVKKARPEHRRAPTPGYQVFPIEIGQMAALENVQNRNTV